MKRNKKIKVVLISNTYSPSPILLVIHEMIKESGHESKYIHIPSYKHNMPSEYFDNIDDKIRPIYEDADLIAFTCMTHTFLAAAKIIGRIRKYTEAPIAMGGIHSTAKPAECLELAEYACIGEGEMAFMELINRLSEGEDTLNVPGFYVKKDGEIIKNPQGKLVEDLDSLPIPDFGLTDQYFLFNGKLVHMKDHLKNQEMLRQYFTRYYFMVTSRGCPYTCKFCVNDVLKRLDPQYRAIRRRSNDHIIKEMKAMKELIKYPIIIGLADDDFFAQSTNSMKEFSEKYQEAKINLPFFCSSTPHSMHPEKMKTIVEAGLFRLELGIQSIHDETNWGIYGRLGLRKDVTKAIKIISPYRNKIQVNYDIILDNPWETEESLLETLNFVFKIPRPCTFAIFSLVPFPGTSLYEKAKAEGKLKHQEKIIYNNDIMLLNNGTINTLFVLYGKFHVPPSIIRMGIKVRNLRPFSTLLRKSTIPLWRFYNYYEGFKTSWDDKNYVLIKYYIRAPFKKIGSTILNTMKTRKKDNIILTTETLIENKEGTLLPVVSSS